MKPVVLAAQLAACAAAFAVGVVVALIAYCVAIGKILWEGEWD